MHELQNANYITSGIPHKSYTLIITFKFGVDFAGKMVEYVAVSSSPPRDTLKLKLNIELPSENDLKTSSTEFLQLRI